MLAQLGDDLFLTDGGMETWLIFDAGFELPEFAAFTLLDDPKGVEALRRYFASYVELARANGVGLVLDAPTWRASSRWGERIGNGGCVGPSDDAYAPSEHVSPNEAYAYHRPQIETFAETPADFVNALTLTYSAEAIGIARAANDVGLPVAISFTVETDGRLPGGES